MPLPPVNSIISAELTSAGFNLADAAPQTQDYANAIADTLKSALISWAPSAQVNTIFLHTPGPKFPVITGPLTVTTLAAFTAQVKAALFPLYDPTSIDDFEAYIGSYLAVPTGDGIGTTFTTWASSCVGSFSIPTGVGVFLDPPANTTVQVAFTPGLALTASNFAPVVDTVVKTLMISLLGGLANANQAYLYGYYGAIAKAVQAIFDALPVSLMVTPLVPTSVGPTGSPGSVAWTLAVV